MAVVVNALLSHVQVIYDMNNDDYLKITLFASGWGNTSKNAHYSSTTNPLLSLQVMNM